MSDQSNYNDKEIHAHIRQATGRRNIDYERRALMQDIVGLALRGEVEDLERKLEELDLDVSAEQKKIILQRARDVRQNALRSR